MKMKVFPRDPWRKAACLFSAAAFSTFAVNLAFTLWATRWQGETVDDGIGVVFEGGCSDIKRLNTAVHVVINILSTVLLAGSNYCMQCAIAPTRSEIDRAHARRKWLDIGVPSIRNFGKIKLEKKALWLLLYNSVMFASTSVNIYKVFIVKEQFILEENRALIQNRSEPLAQMYEGFKTGILKPIVASECLKAYGTPFQSSRGNLLLATNEPDIIDIYPKTRLPSDSFSYYHYEQGYTASLRMREDGQLDQPFEWICLNDDERICEELIPKIREAPQDWRPYEMTVTQFYSQEMEEHCRLLFSVTICWTVTGLNLLKGILMLFVAFRGGDSPILTIGDAVASFLEIPDNFTKAMSLKPKKPFTEE
ncbi:hypothetical protein CH63R_08018 [Colletotrichum higginsianum IMI 349063]|uniref:DUF6536 domain-containing protein n=2 Tax=Colletotrichum higginsianum TaxID=80884 RepID=A0A1B7YAX8_COLHI|nr:hypothetical protein CH63R_08018 [Colletotrichum higginsianum IMI 349063]OBR09253.1 hypothetical protein CH63R_08018 [Colletotrichum higginsianum IMI 349063]TIC95383.1 hypothetical protein CH35J_008141 [Colletotrichum higginsianum]